MCELLKDSANKISNVINQISAYIDEINSGAVKLSTSEVIKIKANFNEIQNNYATIERDIQAVQAAINQGLYDDAISKAKNSLDFANKTYISVENLLNQLESKVATTVES